MESWKPVSELPPTRLTSEPILVVDDYYGKKVVTIGYCWRGNGWEWAIDGDTVSWDLYYEDRKCNITHWMELPSPPETGG